MQIKTLLKTKQHTLASTSPPIVATSKKPIILLRVIIACIGHLYNKEKNIYYSNCMHWTLHNIMLVEILEI